MYATIAGVKVKPGKAEEMLVLREAWTRANRSHGQVAAYLFQLNEHPDEYLAIGIFPSREEYQRFADDSETDCWYRRWRELLEDDPELHDGTVIQAEVFARI